MIQSDGLSTHSLSRPFSLYGNRCWSEACSYSLVRLNVPYPAAHVCTPIPARRFPSPNPRPILAPVFSRQASELVGWFTVCCGLPVGKMKRHEPEMRNLGLLIIGSRTGLVLFCCNASSSKEKRKADYSLLFGMGAVRPPTHLDQPQNMP